jgi:hypothetical protein
MVTDQSDGQLKHVKRLIRSGRKEQARAILHSICSMQPDNAHAWWLVVQVLDNPVWIRDALQRAVRADPNHTRALQQLAQLDRQVNSQERQAYLQPSGTEETIRQAQLSKELLIGADGELLIPVSSPAAPLPRRRFPLVMGFILLMLGLFVVGGLLMISPLRSGSSTVDATPDTFYMPSGLYQNALYFPVYTYSQIDSIHGPPCQERVIVGQVIGGREGLILHARNFSSSLNIHVKTDAQGNYRLTLPAQPVEPVDVLLYDAQGNTLPSSWKPPGKAGISYWL